MARKRLYWAILSISLVILAGCASRPKTATSRKHNTSPVPIISLPSTLTLLDTEVTLSNVRRLNENQIEISHILKSNHADITGSFHIGDVKVIASYKELKADNGSVTAKADGSCISLAYCDVPSSVDKISVLHEVVVHEGGILKFSEFTVKQLPITARSGKLYATIEKITIEPVGSTYQNEPSVALEVTLSPGYSPYRQKLTCGGQAIKSDSGSAYSLPRNKPTRAWFSFPIGKKQHPTKYSFELVIGKKQAEWVRFDGVAIEPNAKN